MSSILYYISGHGFGHAVRSNEVIRRLGKKRPDLKIHVRTAAPEWLFEPEIYKYNQSLDVGIRQKDSLEMDLSETLEACRALHGNLSELIDKETSFISDEKIRLLLGDIPPVGFEIAARASIPSVAVTNFTWNDIYRAYLNEYPAFLPLIEEMEGFYNKTTLALILPYPCDVAVLPRQKAIPWIARTSALTKERAREAFGLPRQATVVLLSFGGLGLNRLAWERMKKLKDYFFVATGQMKQRGKNLLILPNAQHRYEDLVQAVDVIVTKPGYGIMADVLAHRVPILYTDRGEFPEYHRLTEALNDCATAEHIPQKELLDGNLGPYLQQLLAKDKHWPPVSLDGAMVAADKIVQMIEPFD